MIGVPTFKVRDTGRVVVPICAKHRTIGKGRYREKQREKGWGEERRRRKGKEKGGGGDR